MSFKLGLIPGAQKYYWQRLCFPSIIMRQLSRKLFFCVMTFLMGGVLTAQEGSDFQKNFESTYEQRIRKSQINGHYIPRDVKDAMAHLDHIVDHNGKLRFRIQEEEKAVRTIHFSFGRWMMLNWGFYEGSRLSHHLKGLGISYPDDMAATLMHCYHRKLNDKPLEFETLAKHYATLRKKEAQERVVQGELLLTKPGGRKIPKN